MTSAVEVETTDHSAALRALKQLLGAGVLSQGEVVNPELLAERLKLSIRGMALAISTLVAQGLLERCADDRVIVRTVTAGEMAELLDLRAGIEGRVAAHLAVIATDEDVACLRAEIEEQRRAAVTGDKALFMEHAAEFHCMLAERAQFSYAAHIMRTWQDLQKIIGLTALHDKQTMQKIAREHAELLNHVEAHEPMLARECAVQHLKETATRLRLSNAVVA
ncbi:DNA-binding GntR family transcriptional regulator [Caulobacter ginsengisoli]|uniref:DNA-binding GntR family transcriptional regulator n=1 Tax=Caulobacter ginsengisoli TaxID=400775 RepID=A0ABU0IXY8_9CAUL|nr:GntR family transcriptional regulator [Caulobacter ginsengisoli]MDQ0466230.1 DNA-binding GntR family transcriptional regulator [Caulobacter ginsengisoli]